MTRGCCIMERNHVAYSDRLMFCVYRYIYIDVTTLFRKLFERGDPIRIPFLSFESPPLPPLIGPLILVIMIISAYDF